MQKVNDNIKIVVLDGYTLNPGDLSWDSMASLGEFAVYDRTLPEDVIESAGNAEIVLTNKTVLSRDKIEALPNLKYIGVLATGTNVVDLDAASEKGIVVTNVPAYGTASVAQMVFSHILNLCRRVCEHAESVAQGGWAKSLDFCYWNFPPIELTGQTLGIVGCGAIGRDVVKLAAAFGMNILVNDINQAEDLIKQVKFVDLDSLFQESDIITLHCPLTEQTKKLVSRERLEMMKSSAFLINTSRGSLIDEEALAEALNNGIIAGAGLDVLVQEPPTVDNPLYTAKNCYVTPHISWATVSARGRLMNIAVENIKAFLKGSPQNTVG